MQPDRPIPKPPHGNTGNAYAAKPDDETATSYLHIRVNPGDESAWVRAAANDQTTPRPGLAAWVIHHLNKASKK